MLFIILFVLLFQTYETFLFTVYCVGTVLVFITPLLSAALLPLPKHAAINKWLLSMFVYQLFKLL